MEWHWFLAAAGGLGALVLKIWPPPLWVKPWGYAATALLFLIGGILHPTIAATFGKSWPTLLVIFAATGTVCTGVFYIAADKSPRLQSADAATDQPLVPPAQDPKPMPPDDPPKRETPRGPVISAGDDAVISVNQSGGITARTVHVNQEQQATYRLEPGASNVPDGNLFRTELKIRLTSSSVVPDLRIGIIGEHVEKADVHPYDSQGPMIIQSGSGWGQTPGIWVVRITNAYRGYTIAIYTRQPDRLRYEVARGD